MSNMSQRLRRQKQLQQSQKTLCFELKTEDTKQSNNHYSIQSAILVPYFVAIQCHFIFHIVNLVNKCLPKSQRKVRQSCRFVFHCFFRQSEAGMRGRSAQLSFVMTVEPKADQLNFWPSNVCCVVLGNSRNLKQRILPQTLCL